jgi:hypothetical protein
LDFYFELSTFFANFWISTFYLPVVLLSNPAAVRWASTEAKKEWIEAKGGKGLSDREGT